jgi:hypothetical protein
MLAALICGPKSGFSALLLHRDLPNQYPLSIPNNDCINVIFVREDDANSR